MAVPDRHPVSTLGTSSARTMRGVDGDPEREGGGEGS